MAESILANLVQQLGGLVNEEFKVIKGVGEQLKSLEREVRFMKQFLRDSRGKQHEDQSVKVLVDEIREVAFEAEDVIESFILNVERQNQRNTFWKVVRCNDHKAMLYGLAKQIEGIKISIGNIYANKDKYNIERSDDSIDRHFVANLERRRREVDEDMVGFDEVADTLLMQLTQGSTQLEIISIVGMGGLGKTTVAKRIYNNRIIRACFTNRAWVSVSEDYDTRQVILSILLNMGHDRDNIEKQPTDELMTMLKNHLMKTKYIIVLDDVWQRDMWDAVRTYLPDTKNGSRILITSRNARVVSFACHMEPHFLRFLDHEESWELFEKKVFRGDSCPSHLKQLGIKIMHRCNGVPLFIVVMAGMLASQDLSERIWERTLQDVNALLGVDDGYLDILGVSYRSLPEELKPCFLYFAALPEDYEMSVQKLIALWLAEGFIQPLGQLMLEEVAELYLDILIDRCLVQAGAKRTDGGVKTCRIHDLIRSLCISEAERENFMSVASNVNVGASSGYNESKPRRLSVHCQIEGTVLSKGWVPWSTGTFLAFERNREPTTTVFWKKLFTEYKLLRVLDLGNAITALTVPNDFDRLANLRYLSLRLTENEFPQSIYKLRNLQMLFVEVDRYSIIPSSSRNIPIGALLKLQSLQQLKFGTIKTELYGESRSPLSRQRLNNLRVLSSIVPNRDFEDAVTNGLCPKLRKLSLRCPPNYGWSLKNFFTNLAYLQSLKLCYCHSYVGQDIFRGVTVAELPSKLTKITLDHSRWCNKSLNMLGEFPNLLVLKLIHVECPQPYLVEGEYLNVTLRGGLFPKLHTLHLVHFCRYTMALPSSSENTLPNIFGQLRSLLINRCFRSIFDRNLFKLPTLKDVQVLWPDSRLSTCLEELERNNEIKYRLAVYRDD